MPSSPSRSLMRMTTRKASSVPAWPAHISLQSVEEVSYVYPKTDFVSAGNRAKGTLDTRAWKLQQQLLSPRILYFGNGELYWDCVMVSASESSPISASLLHDADPDETWALKLIRKTLAGSKDADVLRIRIAEVWTQIIKNYSSRELTRQSDKLIALKGILHPLRKILNVRGCAKVADA
jgi:hypothetical protein